MNGSFSTCSKSWSSAEIGLNFSDKKICLDLMAFRGKQCLYNPFAADVKTASEEQKTQKYKGIMLDAGWCMTTSVKLKGGIVVGNEIAALTAINKDKFHSVKQNVGLEYKNECTTVDFVIERKNYRGGDLKPETTLQLVVHLKNLGI
jgi:hypothetical protein